MKIKLMLLISAIALITACGGSGGSSQPEDSIVNSAGSIPVTVEVPHTSANPPPSPEDVVQDLSYLVDVVIQCTEVNEKYSEQNTDYQIKLKPDMTYSYRHGHYDNPIELQSYFEANVGTWRFLPERGFEIVNARGVSMVFSHDHGKNTWSHKIQSNAFDVVITCHI